MLLGVVKEGKQFRVKFCFAFSPHRKDEFAGDELYDTEIEAAVAYNEAASKQNVVQKKRKQKSVELNEGLPLTLEAYRRLDATQRKALSQRLRAASAGAENGSPSPSVPAAAADASTVSPNATGGDGGGEGAGGGDGSSLCPEPTGSGNSPGADAPEHGARAAGGHLDGEQRQRTPSEPPTDGGPGSNGGPDRAGGVSRSPGPGTESEQAAGRDAAAGPQSGLAPGLAGRAAGRPSQAGGRTSPGRDEERDSFDDIEEWGQGLGDPAGAAGFGGKGKRTPASVVAASALPAMGVEGGGGGVLGGARGSVGGSGAAPLGVEGMGEEGGQGGALGGPSRAVATLAALAEAAMGSPGADGTPRAPSASAGAEVAVGAAGALLLLGEGSASHRYHLGRPRNAGGQLGQGTGGATNGAAWLGPAGGEAGAGPSAPVAGAQGAGEARDLGREGMEGIPGPSGDPTARQAADGTQSEPGAGTAERAVAGPPAVDRGAPVLGAGQTGQGGGGGLGLREALELLSLSVSSHSCIPTLARAFLDAGGSPTHLLDTLRNLRGVELRQTEAGLRDLAASLPPAPKRQRLDHGSEAAADFTGPSGLLTTPLGSPSPTPAPLSREQYNALLSLHESALFEGDELNFIVERAPAALVGLSKLVAAKADGTPTAVASTAAALGIRPSFLEWLTACSSLQPDVLFAALRIDFDRVEALKPLIAVGGPGGRGLDGQAQQPQPRGVPISDLVGHLVPTCTVADTLLKQGLEPTAGAGTLGVAAGPFVMPGHGDILAGLWTWLRVAEGSGDALELLRALIPGGWPGGGCGVFGDKDAVLVLRIGTKL